jgi:hypothetical protein
MKATAVLLVLSFLLNFTGSGTIRAEIYKAPYLNPAPGEVFAPTGTTLTLRYGPEIVESSLSERYFQVQGSTSGAHRGKVVLADDRKSIIFQPEQPFAPGEEVQVRVLPGIRTVESEIREEVFYSFRTSATKVDASKTGPAAPDLPAASPLAVTQTRSGGYRTRPSLCPDVSVTTPANGVVGDLFMSNYECLLVFDAQGEPVYYQPLVQGARSYDFKKQPNGWLTYWDSRYGYFVALDSSYQLVDTYQAGNGYSTDVHDLQWIEGNHVLLLIYDTQVMDMRAYGGLEKANVIGLVVQELDSRKNVVFEWKSWNHINLTESYADLTQTWVDYVHGNAVELDTDGNLMVSARHLDQVFKIDRNTGNVLWRWGGKSNQFEFISDLPDADATQPFFRQHDIRRLVNGNVTLFDNRSDLSPQYSRALEYELDEINKKAKLVWEYHDPQNTYGRFMGNVQRLPNGNTLVGYGSGPGQGVFSNVIEVKPDGTKAFALSLPAGNISYRAFRYPWHATPYWDPSLVMEKNNSTVTLYFSWNGATEVASYQVWGGIKGQPLAGHLLASVSKTAFEDSYTTTPDSPYCYFKVIPVDKLGRTMRPSPVIENPDCGIWHFFPAVFQEWAAE